MPNSQQERIDTLRRHIAPITPEDTMSEAARKTLLLDFIQMLEHEDGSRSGEDIEHVHDMRVATRRMRSIFLLLNEYFKAKAIDPFQRRLRKIARALGGVRDLDVMLDNLNQFRSTLAEADQAAMQGAVDQLQKRRDAARAHLVRLLDKNDYQRFLDSFGEFLTTPGNGAKAAHAEEPVPSEVRHVLPVEIYTHLAAVRAYDRAVDEANVETLHLLRIEFKRLRYLVSMFEEVLGKSGPAFVEELKLIQDHLGKLNDAVVAQAALRDLMPQLDAPQQAALEAYLTLLANDAARLHATFPEAWRRFNTRAVQRHIAAGIARL